MSEIEDGLARLHRELAYAQATPNTTENELQWLELALQTTLSLAKRIADEMHMVRIRTKTSPAPAEVAQ